ncbi:hypothetical protein [Azohydromonas australica]|uniref:hypothetical protein n=1 Tax=Azohydromonas australica TaxID=364039 RepID=UPI0004076A1D|nr:hypothetical protein [Azohydromonas australica]
MDHVTAQGRVAYSVLSGRECGFLVRLQFVNLAPEYWEIIEKHFQSAGMGWSQEKD